MIVVGVVVDVRQGVFMTSRSIGGIDVVFEDAGVDETTFVSEIDVIGSGTIVVAVVVVVQVAVVVIVVIDGVVTVETGVATRIGAAAATGVVVDPPLATSSITSSICDREADGTEDTAMGAAVVIVGDCLSPFKFDEETIFETRVMRSAD